MRKYLAEVLGTFALVFCGTGAIIINQQSDGAITHVGIAITFGLIVASMIYAVGDISGAHLNPAVTIAFWVAKEFPAKEILPYIVSQGVGAFLATGILKFLFHTCGAVPEEDGTVKIYWGGADTVMCVGTARLDDLIRLCLQHGRAALG